MSDAGAARRACLIGIGHYEDGIAPLPIVRADLRRLQTVLEASDYRVAAHCPADTEAGISRTRLWNLVSDACREAGDGDTLLIYFSGHGGHFNGKDCLVPADAGLRYDDRILDELVPIDDLLASATRDCEAGLVLVIIDACREGMRLGTKALGLTPWGDADRRIADRRQVVVLFSCGIGQFAHFQADDDGDGYSLFTEALCRALAAEAAPTRLDEVLADTERQLDALLREHKKPSQTPWLRGETPATRRQLTQVICNGSATGPATGPSPWADAISRSPLWPEHPTTDAFRSAAVAIVETCWAQHRRARERLPADPWVDDGLPVRLLAALRMLTQPMDDLDLNPAEAALLGIAPFLREGVLARAIEQAADQAPLSLDDTGSGQGLRAVLEKVHRGWPRLLRKAARLRETGAATAADEVAGWLMHRALLREPGVWLPAERPGGLLDGPLLERLDDPADRPALVREALDRARLLELARCCFATPERIDRDDRPGALAQRTHIADPLGDELPIRERLLGWLLLIAGAMARDPRLLSEVLVEHVGLSESPPLAQTIAELAAARWEPDADGRRLCARLSHPAPDYALAEHCEQATALLAAARRAAAQHPACAPLTSLPTRFGADSIAPTQTDQGPAYRRPHLRFRLAQDQILELLMGEQLYGDPALAIRELYQNALDACRYAQARLTYLKRAGTTDALDHWQGRIRFQQGEDQGRPYIECEDNGIGMGIRELTDCFTQAGRRFADTPEFIEEQTEWLAQDVRLYPNSQFGIGVLSYFMLADDFEVETCRMDRDGQPGEALHAFVTGSGSLIRLRGGTREGYGTRIRLYLNRTERPVFRRAGGVQLARISAVETLQSLLWVAEYRTEAKDAQSVVQWKPYQLGDTENDVLRGATCATEDCDYWWRGPGGYAWPHGDKGPILRLDAGPGFVLVDGLVTWTEDLPDFFILNLRNERRPSLTVDRKRVRDIERDWFEEIGARQAHALVAWSNLCLVTLAKLTDFIPQVVDEVFSRICEQREVIAIENEVWQLGLMDLLRNADVRSDGASLPTTAGFFASDAHFFLRCFRQGKDALSQRHVVLSAAFENYKPVLVLPRIKSLYQNDVSAALRDAQHIESALKSIPDFVPVPSDEVIVPGTPGWFMRSPTQPELASILDRSVRLGRAPSEIVSRLENIGFSTCDYWPDWDFINKVDSTDLVMTSRNVDAQPPWIDIKVAPAHVLRAASKTGVSAEDVRARLTGLGFKLHEPEDGWDSLKVFEDGDEQFMGYHDGDSFCHRWLEPEVSITEIYSIAVQTEQLPVFVVDALLQLGYRIANQDVAVASHQVLPESDRMLIAEITKSSLRQRRSQFVSIGTVLRHAASFGLHPDKVASRLRELGFSLPVPEPDWRRITVGNLDLEVLRETKVLENAWVEYGVLPGHVLFIADRLERTPEQIETCLASLGFAVFAPHASWPQLTPYRKRDRRSMTVDMEENEPILYGVDLPQIPVSAHALEMTPEDVVGRLLELGYRIGKESWPHELEIIVQLWHDCSREEATRRLVEAGWTPPDEPDGKAEDAG